MRVWQGTATKTKVSPATVASLTAHAYHGTAVTYRGKWPDLGPDHEPRVLRHTPEQIAAHHKAVAEMFQLSEIGVLPAPITGGILTAAVPAAMPAGGVRVVKIEPRR